MMKMKRDDSHTCRGFPRSAGRRAGPDGAGGGSAPGLSHPTSGRWGPSLPRRTSSERLELPRVDKSASLRVWKKKKKKGLKFLHECTKILWTPRFVFLQRAQTDRPTGSAQDSRFTLISLAIDVLFATSLQPNTSQGPRDRLW